VPRERALMRLGVVTWLAVAVSLYLIFFVAREADVTMGGQLQRIFYFHVPAAWAAYLAFGVVFLGSIAFLRTGAERWDLLAHSAAEVGVLFSSIVLVTGPIWAKPVWGTYWQWDARLTSSLVMWLTYVGYLLLRGLSSEPHRTGRLAAVVGIVGFINVPIVHFSVELTAFFMSLLAFTLLFAWLMAARVRLGRLEARLHRLEAAS
jgi:heme exporter protein C